MRITRSAPSWRIRDGWRTRLPATTGRSHSIRMPRMRTTTGRWRCWRWATCRRAGRNTNGAGRRRRWPAPAAISPQPQWHGEAAPGRTLLIHAEQGFGDTIQFCRYAARAAASGLRVILEVQPPLVRLLQTLPGVDRVIARGEPCPAFGPALPDAQPAPWRSAPRWRPSPAPRPTCTPTRRRSPPGRSTGIRRVCASAWPGRAVPAVLPRSRPSSTGGAPSRRTGWRPCSPCRGCISSACKRTAPRRRQGFR